MPAWYELQDLTLRSLNRGLDLKLDMYMWTPGGNIVKIWQNLKIPHFDPQGQVMSEKCEQPFDERTV